MMYDEFINSIRTYNDIALFNAVEAILLEEKEVKAYLKLNHYFFIIDNIDLEVHN